MYMRLLTVLILVFMENWPMFQAMILLEAAVYRLSCTISWMPYTIKYLNILEICNDSAVWLCLIVILRLSDKGLSEKHINIWSWVTMINCSLNISIHFVANFYITFLEVKQTSIKKVKKYER